MSRERKQGSNLRMKTSCNMHTLLRRLSSVLLACSLLQHRPGLAASFQDPEPGLGKIPGHAQAFQVVLAIQGGPRFSEKKEIFSFFRWHF